MTHSLSPNEKQAIDDILNEAANKFAPDLQSPLSLQTLDERSKQVWGDWNDSITNTPKSTLSNQSKTKPFSQIIREKNPSLFKTTQFDSDSDEDELIEPSHTPIKANTRSLGTKDDKTTTPLSISKKENDNFDNFYNDQLHVDVYDVDHSDNEDEDLNNHSIYSANHKSHSRLSSKDPDFASKILKKAQESKILSSYKFSDESDSFNIKGKSQSSKNTYSTKSITPIEKHKKINASKANLPATSTKKKTPSLYQRSLKREHVIDSAYDRFDIARLRQDNIEAKQTIAKLQAALDKANIENEKLRKSLQESERIRMKQKTQISYILSEK